MSIIVYQWDSAGDLWRFLFRWWVPGSRHCSIRPLRCAQRSDGGRIVCAITEDCWILWIQNLYERVGILWRMCDWWSSLAISCGCEKGHEFACGGSTTCQYVEKLVEVPPGYVAMPSVGSMAGYEYHHRGIAQQIQWAAATLPQEIWSDPKTWIILGPLSNDVIYHGAQAIGSTTSEASRCPFVQNHRQMLEDLANLGVTSDRIISCGLIPLDLLPGLQGDLDLVWFRAQQEVVNRCLDAMLKHPRWPLDKLIQGLWSEAPAVKLG